VGPERIPKKKLTVASLAAAIQACDSQKMCLDAQKVASDLQSEAGAKAAALKVLEYLNHVNAYR
jgi:UDP:flavonoid glycosyltransferase YjiC (YdhE family)